MSAGVQARQLVTQCLHSLFSQSRHSNTRHSVGLSEFPSLRFALPRDHADASGFSDGLTPIEPLLLRVNGSGEAPRCTHCTQLRAQTRKEVRMIAVALSSKARALIQADRDAHRPTAADRERITAALRARLGSSVLPLEAPIRSRLLSSRQRRSATAFGMCVVGSMLFLSRRPSTTMAPATQLRNKPALVALSATALAMSPEPQLPSEVAAPARTTAPAQAAAPAHATAPTRHRMAPTAARRPLLDAAAPPAAPDPLAEEVRLLSNAMSQLSSGQAELALLVLEEHQRRFSSGALSDERNAAKARALCALHRFSEGRAALAPLSAGTPLAARAKQDCD